MTVHESTSARAMAEHHPAGFLRRLLDDRQRRHRDSENHGRDSARRPGNAPSLGAAQSRRKPATQTLKVEFENLSSAISRIRDVDVAEESTQFAKYNILVQSGVGHACAGQPDARDRPQAPPGLSPLYHTRAFLRCTKGRSSDWPFFREAALAREAGRIAVDYIPRAVGRGCLTRCAMRIPGPTKT